MRPTHEPPLPATSGNSRRCVFSRAALLRRHHETVDEIIVSRASEERCISLPERAADPVQDGITLAAAISRPGVAEPVPHSSYRIARSPQSLAVGMDFYVTCYQQVRFFAPPQTRDNPRRLCPCVTERLGGPSTRCSSSGRWLGVAPSSAACLQE
jgi:hypothetical protein